MGLQTGQIRTYQVAVSGSATTTEGAKSIDILNPGTTNAQFTGNSSDGFTSTAVIIPGGYTYTLEYNERGYKSITINNTSDAALSIVEKF